MSRLNVMLSAVHRSSRGTAEPPLPEGTRVPTMAEWKRERHQPRPSIWGRLCRRSA